MAKLLSTPPEIGALARGITVVVPVYNSEQILPTLAARVAALFAGGEAAYEIIFVNDCSRDGSWRVIEDLVARDPHIRGIDLMRNYHQHNALLCGIRAALYDIVVTMDDDLQHPPERIPQLLAKLAEGYDVVYGAPRELPHGLLRNLASTITKITLQGAIGAETARRISAFRVFRTELREAFCTFSGPYVSIDVLLTWGTARFTHIFVRHEPRLIGESNYTLRTLLTHALNMMTGFSTLPLQVASLAGFAIMAFGVFVLGLVVVRYFVDNRAPQGFPFLASIIALFSGTQLFALGVIGEYLARMHFRLMDRPSYTIRRRL